MLQAAPTGYSAIMLPDGQVRARSQLGAPALLRERVPLRTGLTPFAQFGDIPMLALASALILLPKPTRRTRRTAPASAFPAGESTRGSQS